MTRDILRQTLGNYHLKEVSKDDSVTLSKDEPSETNEANRRDDQSKENQETENNTSESGIRTFPVSKNKPVNFVDVRVQGTGGGRG